MEKVLTSSSCNTQDGKVWMHALTTTPTSIEKKSVNYLETRFSAESKTLIISKAKAIGQLHIYDQTGRLCKAIHHNASDQIEINLQGMNSGIYIIQGVDRNHQYYISKFVL